MKWLFGKKKKEEKAEPKKPTQAEDLNRRMVSKRHQARIENLKDEMEDLAHQLKTLELDTEIPNSKKEKESNRIIKRLTLIDYEIGVRENVLQWL